MLVAVSLNAPVGIDVEALRPIENMLSIAGFYFSEAELQELLSIRPEDRCRAFYAGWTRKEAFVKATGEGMGRDFRSFRRHPLALGCAADRGHPIGVFNGERSCLAGVRVEPCPGYVAAVVAHGKGWRLARVD